MSLKKRKLFETHKDVRKLIKSTIELAVIALLLYIGFAAWLNPSGYSHFTDEYISRSDHGFVVVSYSGVERKGSQVAIGADALEAQLKALYESGYRTISQQDVIDYYLSGKNLPERALLLVFEDATRESTVFAQRVMEKYNFKATMMGFAGGLELSDAKYLTDSDIKRYQQT